MTKYEQLATDTAKHYGHTIWWRGEVSGSEFADAIRAAYLPERHHLLAARCAELYLESIESTPDRLFFRFRVGVVDNDRLFY